jgi:hypothetical protein
MKRLSTTILALALLAGVAADAWAVPATISFTGRLSTANGPVSGNVAMTFSLYAQATAGTPVWSEARPSVAASAGLVYAELGGLTTLDETVITDGPLFLEIRIGNETLAPRLPLQSVPYAIRAEAANTADTLGTIEPDDVLTGLSAGAGVSVVRSGNSATLGLAPCASGQVLKAGAGGAWTCAADIDTNTTYTASNGVALAGSVFGLAPCASGQVLKAGAGGTWACASDTDTNTTYSATANSGVALSGTAFGLTTCASGQVLKAGAGGTWACAADTDTNTTYSAAANGGIIMSGTAFGLTGCSSGQVLKSGSTPGTWACANEADGIRLFVKHGNNGAASCTEFCRGSQWGAVGDCLGGRTTAGAYLGCDTAPGAGTTPELTCMCAGL